MQDNAKFLLPAPKGISIGLDPHLFGTHSLRRNEGWEQEKDRKAAYQTRETTLDYILRV
jgi:hypothetical protein